MTNELAPFKHSPKFSLLKQIKIIMNTKYLFRGLTLLTIATNANAQKHEENRINQNPNIIIILADDLGYGSLGCYGQKKIKTPHIDQMAKEGIRYTNAYCGTSVSAPSRCVLMTGMHTGHAAIRGNAEVNPYGQYPLPDSCLTIAEMLKQNGYYTGLMGKWGLVVENTEGDPQSQGFDDFFGYYCQVDAHNSFPEFLMKNQKKVFLTNKVQYESKDHWSRGRAGYATEKKQYSNQLITEQAIKYIDSVKNEPFFVYLSLTIPHDNGEAPKNQIFEVPDFGIYKNKNWSENDKAYAAMITQLDKYVGDINHKLKELGLDQNTIVIFTSDNGAEYEGIFNSNGNLRGGKRDMYEGGIRVPMIVHWPEKIKKARTSNQVCAFWDIMPTIADVINKKDVPRTDGISILPDWLGLNCKYRDYLYWEFHEQGKKQAVLQGDWKLIHLNVSIPEKECYELYNIQKDPTEKNDIAFQNPKMVEKLKLILQQEHIANPDWKFLPGE